MESATQPIAPEKALEPYTHKPACTEAREKIIVSEKPRPTFAEFWPEYVLAHQQPWTRALHFVATLLAFALLLAFLWTFEWRWLALAPILSYAVAWFSHFVFERNHPATWEHPLLSWLADQKMCALLLAGRMGAEVERIRAARSAATAPPPH